MYGQTDSTNKGFNEKQCEADLEDIKTAYNTYMDEISTYQEQVNKMCEYWRSTKGSETITQLVSNFNNFFDYMDGEFANLFNYVNAQADIISKDSDGIGYSHVKFSASTSRFNSEQASDGSDGVVQWNEDITGVAINKIESFIDDDVKKQLKTIRNKFDSIKSNFGSYSEAAAAIATRMSSLGEQIDAFISGADGFLSGLSESYIADAKEHAANVAALEANQLQETAAPTYSWE